MASHMISGLVAKRAQLAGKIADHEAKIVRLRDQIEHVDRVLALFGYGGTPSEIKPRGTHVYLFKRREVPNYLADLTREGATLTNRQAALRLMASKGWDVADGELVRKVMSSLKSARKYHGRKKR